VFRAEVNWTFLRAGANWTIFHSSNQLDYILEQKQTELLFKAVNLDYFVGRRKPDYISDQKQT